MVERKTRQAISGPIMEYLHDKQNLVVTVGEIAKAIGRTESAVQGAMWAIRNRTTNQVQIDVIESGRAWVFRGAYVPEQPVASKPTRDLYEYVATLKSGRVLVQDEQGTVYTLTELE